MNDDLSSKASRRSVLLNGITYAAGLVAIVAANISTALAEKIPQKSVAYQDTPKGPLKLKCSDCILFEPPAACKSVAGVISPDGWCALYRKT
jgi:hypothetical protein